MCILRAALLALLGLPLACGRPPDPAGGGGADGSTQVHDDSGESGGDDGTTGVAPVPANIEAEVSELVGTVITVRWTTDEPTTGLVRFGEAGALDRVTPSTAEGTTHEALLLGLPLDTEISFQVEASSAQAVGSSAVSEIRTSPPPAGFPTLTFTGEPAAGPAYQIIPVDGSSNQVIIVDRQGRVVWYQLLDTNRHVVRAVLSPDRDAVVICLAAWPGNPEAGTIQWVSWTGDIQREEEIVGSRMDLAQLPDGTIAAITRSEQDGYDAVGDAIVEIAPDGVQTEVWNSWTALDEDLYEIASVEPGGDFTHANALDYLPDRDAYSISLWELQTLLLVDRSTGAREWTMFGVENDWSFTAGTEEIERMHQHELTDGRLLIFDNGSTERLVSRVVELSLDEATQTATEVWSYTREPSVYTYIKGDVRRLEDGGTLVVWSTSGEVQVVDQEGEVRWQLDAELGYVFLYVDLFEDLYPGG